MKVEGHHRIETRHHGIVVHVLRMLSKAKGLTQDATKCEVISGLEGAFMMCVTIILPSVRWNSNGMPVEIDFLLVNWTKTDLVLTDLGYISRLSG